MRVTRDMLSIEEDDGVPNKWKVVAWSSDGVPCTVDDRLTADDAQGLLNALTVTLETWT